MLETHAQHSRRLIIYSVIGLLLFILVTSYPVSAAEKIPRLANGKPDFSGIWQTLSAADYGLEPHNSRKDSPPGAGVVEGNTIPYLPEALTQRDNNFNRRLTLDPALRGWTLGIPRGIYYPEPFQIFQRPRDIHIIFQFGHSIRTIHTNNTQHPDDGYDLLLGDSRAHWEKDTLIVDTINFTDKTWLDRAGNFHSAALHLIEYWKFLDPDTIAYKATLEDPNVYSRPWTINIILHRHREENFQLIEDYRFTLDFDDIYPPKRDNK